MRVRVRRSCLKVSEREIERGPREMWNEEIFSELCFRVKD